MQSPKPKSYAPFLPQLWVRSIVTTLKDYYHNRKYDSLTHCPHCGSSLIIKNGWRTRIFALVISSSYQHNSSQHDQQKPFEPITVLLRRYFCKHCHKHFSDPGPFYPNTLYGAPIVNLALFLAAKNPYHRVEHILMTLGIQADRDTVRSWVQRFASKVAHLYGIKIFDEPIAINMLRLLFQVDNVAELRKKYPELEKAMVAVADETYPTKKGAKKALREENATRKTQQGKKKQTKKHHDKPTKKGTKKALREEKTKHKAQEKKKRPEAITVATAYLPLIKTYASVLVNNNAFNQLLAAALLSVLSGVDLLCVDGHKAYDIMPHVHCVVHEARNLRKKDPAWKQAKNDPNITPEQLREIAHTYYKKVQKERQAEVEAKDEDLSRIVKENPGILTTNAIEGGNWRLKYELRVPYSNLLSLLGRLILITLEDSMATFQKGRPVYRFGSQYSEFSYEQVMSIGEVCHPFVEISVKKRKRGVSKTWQQFQQVEMATANS